MKPIIYFAFCFFYVVVLPAQHYLSLSGTVLSPNQQAIEFASISLYPITDSTDIIGVISDQNGAFELSNLKIGTYQLTIQMLGYEDWTQQYSISENLEIGQVVLQEEASLLSTVEVVAQQSLIESHLGKKVLRIGQDLSATGSNALEALENIPSVHTTPRGEVQIRGNNNVIIYINGKETKREASTLKFISADVLEKIEVMTNPSAKYDAEGVAGIINLVYKKNKISSFKLEAISNVSVLTNPLNFSPNGGLNTSWNKDKFAFFTNVSLDYNRYVNMIDSKRHNFQEELQQYENRSLQTGKGLVANVNVGLSIEPDTSLSMGLELNYDRWDFISDIHQKNTFDYRNAMDTSVDINHQGGELENELWVNYSLEKKLKSKQNLKLSLSIGGEDEVNFTYSDPIDSSNSPEPIEQFLLSSDETERQRYYQGKIDFETPFFNWGTIETGLKADFIRYDILQKVQLRSHTIVLPDNDFGMDMQKLGFYILQNHRIKKLEYALGLRLEQFSSKAIQQADHRQFTQNYIRLFPSVQLNYLLPNADHSIGFNYTRRINRPGFFDLNPFVSYEDPLNLETGNPALRPEIADLYEFTYHLVLNTFSLDITLYNRITSDAIQSIVSRIDNNRSLASYTNIGQQNNRGIETQMEFRLGIFKTTGTFVLGQVQYSDLENEISYHQQTTWSLRFKQQLQLKNNWKIELSEIYQAPSYQIQEKRHEAYYVNLSVNKKFNSKRGSLSLVIKDIFNTRQYKYSLLTTAFEIERRYKWQTRQITVGWRYNIFNGKT